MAVLLIAEVTGGDLGVDSTAKALTAAASLGEVTLLVAGAGCAPAAAAAAGFAGCGVSALGAAGTTFGAATLGARVATGALTGSAATATPIRRSSLSIRAREPTSVLSLAGTRTFAHINSS